VNFKKSCKFPRFPGEGVPFRRHAKTAVIPMVFIGSGARFLPRTLQNRNYWFFARIRYKSPKVSEFSEIPSILIKFSDFPPCGGPGAKTPMNP
jgi:hypothetical protein